MIDQSAAPEMSEPGEGVPASAEPDTISLQLGDLLPDSAGNIVIEYDGGNLAVQLMTDQSVVEHGVAVEASRCQWWRSFRYGLFLLRRRDHGLLPDRYQRPHRSRGLTRRRVSGPGSRLIQSTASRVLLRCRF